MISESSDKLNYQIEIFRNRLLKRYRHLRKWASRAGISSFRLYDRDIPEIPLTIDLYNFLSEKDFLTLLSDTICDNNAEKSGPSFLETATTSLKNIHESRVVEGGTLTSGLYALVYSYLKKTETSPECSKEWLECMLDVCCEVLSLQKEKVILKTRYSQTPTLKYKNLSRKSFSTREPLPEGIITDNGILFFINLWKHIDTGIFFDMRMLRTRVKTIASGKRVLNLFSYTGGFSLASLAGGAKSVESVDLAKTYLSWCKLNFSLNGFLESNTNILTQGDCIETLKRKIKRNAALPTPELFDLIILDPPTFSNSKRTRTVLDIREDYIDILLLTLRLLSDGGTVYFSTNSKKFSFNEALLSEKSSLSLDISDITRETLPEDCKGHFSRRVYEIKKLPQTKID